MKTISVSDEVFERLQREAARTGESVDSIVADLFALHGVQPHLASLDQRSEKQSPQEESDYLSVGDAATVLFATARDWADAVTNAEAAQQRFSGLPKEDAPLLTIDRTYTFSELGFSD